MASDEMIGEVTDCLSSVLQKYGMSRELSRNIAKSQVRALRNALNGVEIYFSMHLTPEELALRKAGFLAEYAPGCDLINDDE